MKEKKKNPLFVGILSIILGFHINCKPDFGDHRLVLAFFIPKGLDYKTEKFSTL